MVFPKKKLGLAMFLSNSRVAQLRFLSGSSRLRGSISFFTNSFRALGLEVRKSLRIEEKMIVSTSR